MLRRGCAHDRRVQRTESTGHIVEYRSSSSTSTGSITTKHTNDSGLTIYTPYPLFFSGSFFTVVCNAYIEESGFMVYFPLLFVFDGSRIPSRALEVSQYIAGSESDVGGGKFQN